MDYPMSLEQEAATMPGINEIPSLDFLEFTDDYDRSGVVFITYPDGTSHSIHGISVAQIGSRCPVFALTFEQRADGSQNSYVEARCRDQVVCFLRFLYTGTYGDFETVDRNNLSLLIDVELYQMGATYDIPELQVEAYSNVTRKTTLACSFPKPPTELCEAIRFVYGTLPTETGLLEDLLTYCVSNFLNHSLGQNKDFLKVVADVKAFHDDLAAKNCERNFEDFGAAQIIQLPINRRIDNARAAAEKAAMDAFLTRLWCDRNTSTDLPKNIQGMLQENQPEENKPQDSDAEPLAGPSQAAIPHFNAAGSYIGPLAAPSPLANPHVNAASSRAEPLAFRPQSTSTHVGASSHTGPSTAPFQTASPGVAVASGYAGPLAFRPQPASPYADDASSYAGPVMTPSQATASHIDDASSHAGPVMTPSQSTASHIDDASSHAGPSTAPFQTATSRADVASIFANGLMTIPHRPRPQVNEASSTAATAGKDSDDDGYSFARGVLAKPRFTMTREEAAAMMPRVHVQQHDRPSPNQGPMSKTRAPVSTDSRGNAPSPCGLTAGARNPFTDTPRSDAYSVSSSDDEFVDVPENQPSADNGGILGASTATLVPEVKQEGQAEPMSRSGSIGEDWAFASRPGSREGATGF